VLRRGVSDTARENAAAALTLSGPPETSEVQEAGALPPLLDLLKGGSLRGKKDSALALFNLSLEEKCVEELVAQGSVPVLVSLLGTAEADMPGMEDKVMAVIANLCKFAREGRRSMGTGASLRWWMSSMGGRRGRRRTRLCRSTSWRSTARPRSSSFWKRGPCRSSSSSASLERHAPRPRCVPAREHECESSTKGTGTCEQYYVNSDT